MEPVSARPYLSQFCRLYGPCGCEGRSRRVVDRRPGGCATRRTRAGTTIPASRTATLAASRRCPATRLIGRGPAHASRPQRSGHPEPGTGRRPARRATDPDHQRVGRSQKPPVSRPSPWPSRLASTGGCCHPCRTCRTRCKPSTDPDACHGTRDLGPIARPSASSQPRRARARSRTRTWGRSTARA